MLYLLGCIECMRCGLLQSINDNAVAWYSSLSVCHASVARKNG